ncbi:unnamed protein product [Clavelina lepadiformis]|uniref:B-related factor 1 n=1 Tax=Clavelina lepadiformis TaxID=159417 RepID=A0ABP0FJW1_CLALP
MGKTCPHCKSSDLDVDPSRGDTVCMSCGSVLEENTIVSEVTIQENADGSASVVGQFVSSEGSYKPYLSGFQYGMGKESRQITLDNGKQQIRELAGLLNLNKHCTDTAFNFFKMAIMRRLSRGRRIKHIVAACLYMTCRTESTPHMLLDFSDITQVNVFTLGKVFLLLAKELHIHLPVLDPCMYITRFSHRLDFGEKTHDVSVTAMRLVSRMKRDWLHTGRRPSGLCGAALLVAARLHGFNCDMDDVVKVVKIGHDTIRKRLTEFESTPSSKLTINEFMNIDLEAEHDPPAFINGRIKAKIQQLEAEAGGMNNIEQEIGKISNAIDDQLMKNSADTSGSEKKSRSKVIPDVNADIASNSEIPEDPDLKAAAGFINSENPEMLAEKILSPGRKAKTPTTVTSRHGIGPAPTAASLGLKQSVSECLATPSRSKVEEEKMEDTGELDLEGIDDEEIDKLILSPHERKIKEKIWMMENGGFLKELEERREQRRIEAEKKEKSKPKTRRSKAVRKSDYYGDSKTAGEAIEKLMSRQKLSNKINYEALRKATEDDVITNKSSTSYKTKLSPSQEIKPKTSGLKRESNQEPVVPVKKAKIQQACLNPSQEKTKPEEKPTVIEESGVVIHHEHDEEDPEEEEDPDDNNQCMSASQLMHQAGLASRAYGDDLDYGDDYD